MSYEYASPGCSSVPYRSGLLSFRFLTPVACADTPTHTKPPRSSSAFPSPQSGDASTPPLTFCHSTWTTPLNFAGSFGRRTSARVRYGAVLLSCTLQRPSAGSEPVGSYARAVPSRKNSSST